MKSVFVSYGATLAFLYADPGSGMLLWQLITAAAFGLLFYARTIIRKVRALIGTPDPEEQSNSNIE
jgi:hypothetical protein